MYIVSTVQAICFRLLKQVAVLQSTAGDISFLLKQCATQTVLL